MKINTIRPQEGMRFVNSRSGLRCLVTRVTDTTVYFTDWNGRKHSTDILCMGTVVDRLLFDLTFSAP